VTEKQENEGKSPQVELAEAAIEAWIKEGRKLASSDRPEETGSLKGRAGAFVSLKKDGRLRGCIGTFQPTRANLAEEIISNAISAACRDPRFQPVEREELGEIDVSVDVLSDPELITDPSKLDAAKYGIIVQKGDRVGLLLPDLEGVDTVEDQLSIARRKAGIGPDEQVQLYRFTVTRYH
jgi:AmmeMemoRadiSam system protein A